MLRYRNTLGMRIHNKLSQGVKTAVDFCQREMVKLNEGLDRVKVFLDDTGISWK